MTRYQAVFFDAGDTLLDFHAAGDRITHLVSMHLGWEIPLAEARPYFDTAYRYALSGSKNGLLWVNNREQERHYYTKYYQAWLTAAGIAPDPSLIATLVEDTLRVEVYQTFPDVEPTLERLRAANIRCVLVSNAFPTMQQIMQHLALEAYFQECLYSCKVGYEKPGTEIFDLALAAAGLPPAATCLVDDVPHNVEAAISLGIQGFLIDRWERYPYSPLPKLASLTELCTACGL